MNYMHAVDAVSMLRVHVGTWGVKNNPSDESPFLCNGYLNVIDNP